MIRIRVGRGLGELGGGLCSFVYLACLVLSILINDRNYVFGERGFASYMNLRRVNDEMNGLLLACLYRQVLRPPFFLFFFF